MHLFRLGGSLGRGKGILVSWRSEPFYFDVQLRAALWTWWSWVRSDFVAGAVNRVLWTCGSFSEFGYIYTAQAVFWHLDVVFGSVFL